MTLPLTQNYVTRTVLIDGQSQAEDVGQPGVGGNVVAPGYFSTLGIPLIAGRDFSRHDVAGPRVAVVNEMMAERFWPGENPIGKRFRIDRSKSEPVEVVGVARNVKYRALSETAWPVMYLPLAQHYQPQMVLHARTAVEPLGLLPALRSEVAQLDPQVAVFDVKTMSRHLDDTIWPQRTLTTLTGILGIAALVLAAIGLYGVLSYEVALRTREIGIRLALGAQKRDVIRLVVGHGLLLTAIGIGLGIAASFGATRLMAHLLFGLSATDPLTVPLMTLLMTCVALLAACDKSQSDHCPSLRVERFMKDAVASSGNVLLMIGALLFSASSNPVNLTRHGSSDAEPMWSPDGKKIAFYSDRNAGTQSRFRIYLMNADGSSQVELPGSRADFRPVWSPDGKQLAFDSYRDGNHEIYTVNEDGSNLKRLTNGPAYDSSPRWSPDGRKIVYFSGPDWKPGASNYGASDIWLMNADGSGKVRLTMSEGDDTYPFFSPDGRRIVFTSWRDGNAEIYVMNADGSNQRKLTNNPARDDNARWSPDGKKIGFGSNRDGNYEVYLMNADGSEQTNLTRHPGNDVDPAWSPDGKKLAFVSNRDGNYDIYVIEMAVKR
jgi:Tol biopolymer transport system component